MPDSAAYRTLRDRWSRQGDIASVEANAVFTLEHRQTSTLTADPLADSLSHLDVIRARSAWEITTGDAAVRIGLVDTGLDLDHPDLAAQVAINPGEDVNGNGRADPGDWNGIDDDGNGWIDDLRGYDFVDRPNIVEGGDYRDRDPDPGADPAGPFSGHATAVAGAMSAAQGNGTGIVGVAPGAGLVPLRAFGGDGRGQTDDIAAAILYAVQMQLDVVNLSFGRDYASPLLESVVQYAAEQGTIVIASAGNNGGDDPHYPSDYPSVISVAWLNRDGTDIAFRGEYGIGIDLGAPGTGIFTTLKPAAAADRSPDERYGRQSGSSMAAPLVSGAAALLRSVDPALSPAAVSSILTASAADVGAPGWDHRTASGRLDVAAALARALPARTEIAQPAHNRGTAADQLPIVGTAIDPAFASYALYYAAGTRDLDTAADPWIQLAGPVDRQVVNDTLAVFPAGQLEEGAYTLRLVTTLRSGDTVEDRRRLIVDRSPPSVIPTLLEVGLVEAGYGIVADVSTDDLSTAQMTLTRDGRTHVVHSAVRNRRHGLSWPDPTGRGGPVAVQLSVTNASGLTTTLDTTLAVPARRVNSALFEETALDVPHGVLLPEGTDFDADGLAEIVFNQYDHGALGDTLRSYEWAGAGFRPADTLMANVIPRDVGDSDGDGRAELLTQVGGATLVLEQPAGGGFPRTQQFVDTTGLQNPAADAAVWGARLTDLDRDGRGEILAHNRSVWRVLEWDGTSYTETARLSNPTGVDGADAAVTPNGFQQPKALVADFDTDGRPDVLVGDNDGDWVMYETGDNDPFRVAWTHETNRIDAGARFAHGDADGDGDLDFVTYTQNLPILRADGAREPPIGVYYFWTTEGDDAYELARLLPVQGNTASEGALTMADFDGDGREDVAIVHPPHLYVLSRPPEGEWMLRYHRGVDTLPNAGLRSPAVVADDLDGDGQPELLAATADGRFHLWQVRRNRMGRAPPDWVTARSASATSVRLRWRAPQADSVTVLGGAPASALDPIATVADSSVVLETSSTRQYALRAWYGGEASELSRPRRVRPHEAATVQSVSYPSPRSVAITFTEPIDPAVQPSQFVLDRGGAPSALLRQAGGRRIVLRFDAPPTPREDLLRWSQVVDAESMPVGSSALPVAFPRPAASPLIVEQWAIKGQQSVILQFNAPLDPSAVADPAQYRLRPRGYVRRVAFDPEQPTRLHLEVADVVLGAVGTPVALRLSGLRSAAGAALGAEGNTVRLVEPADDLADVYVYPNPYHARHHDAYVTVAGLPVAATVRILSPQGTLVRTLEEAGRDGGLRWDLQDESGRRVPSGVYLIRVEAPGSDPVLRKAAIVR